MLITTICGIASKVDGQKSESKNNANISVRRAASIPQLLKWFADTGSCRLSGVGKKHVSYSNNNTSNRLIPHERQSSVLKEFEKFAAGAAFGFAVGRDRRERMLEHLAVLGRL